MEIVHRTPTFAMTAWLKLTSTGTDLVPEEEEYLPPIDISLAIYLAANQSRPFTSIWEDIVQATIELMLHLENPFDELIREFDGVKYS